MAANTGNLLLHHEFAHINGIKMHYVTIGEGPLIVFFAWIPRVLEIMEASNFIFFKQI